MSVAEIIRQARALIERPENWLKGVLVRTLAGGQGVTVTDPRAARFCAAGALGRAAGGWGPPFEAAIARLDDAAWRRLRMDRALPGSLIVYNNDPATTHADILSLFDEAAAERLLEDPRR